ncbi:hypothetical protein F4809DRAFT_24222 [Biscogniauxia mediterranea]|nr:hypothetical protein F4809DRAFT_24222 [Biscogniauxia mediterranea]
MDIYDDSVHKILPVIYLHILGTYLSICIYDMCILPRMYVLMSFYFSLWNTCPHQLWKDFLTPARDEARNSMSTRLSARLGDQPACALPTHLIYGVSNKRERVPKTRSALPETWGGGGERHRQSGWRWRWNHEPSQADYKRAATPDILAGVVVVAVVVVVVAVVVVQRLRGIDVCQYGVGRLGRLGLGVTQSRSIAPSKRNPLTLSLFDLAEGWFINIVRFCAHVPAGTYLPYLFLSFPAAAMTFEKRRMGLLTYLGTVSNHRRFDLGRPLPVNEPIYLLTT